MLSLTALTQQIPHCMQADQFRLRRRLKEAGQQADPERQQALLEKTSQAIAKSVQRRELRQSQRPEIRYPEELPVSQKKDAIAAAIRDHQVVIIAGETGSGKTTQIPKICLELGRGVAGLIGHTQPRRLAARSVAARIAEELESEPGRHVGYKIRFSDHTSPQSYIKLMTDGILLAEIQNDRFLNQYDTLIIDEAHERSLNIDFLLGYLKQLLPKRPDLKLIITSATIDPERFSRHFDDAPIIEVSGRTYPVEMRYRPIGEEERDQDLNDAIGEAVRELYHEPRGDILIFMNGEREIRDTADFLERMKLRDTEILPLFSRLSNAEQNRIFQSHRGRRIVLATNVAETSLTVPGIRYVIDPGSARISRYSYRTKVQRLPIEAISQASANQRAGRCGRVAAGICIRLYSEEDFAARPEFTDPEILRTNLASVILQMAALGLGDMGHFPFVEAPDQRHIQDGLRLLEELGAVNLGAKDPRKRLTPLGRQLARLPLDPRLARVVLAASEFGCVHEVMVISAALSIQDPRERPLDKQQAADEQHRRFYDKDSDFITWVNLWNYLQQQQEALSNSQFRKLCRKEFLAYMRIREWQDIYAQLRQALDELEIRINHEPANYRAIHCALIAGMLSHIGIKDKEREYLGARNARFQLFPGSTLSKKPPKWVMVAELVETSKLFGRIAAKIQPEWVEPLAQHLVRRSYSEPHWEKKPAMVAAAEKQTLFGLPLVVGRRVNYGPINPVEARELFIRQALVEGEFNTRHPFFRRNLERVAEVQELEHKSRRRDILVDDETLFVFYDERLPAEIVSGVHFDKWWRKTAKQQPQLLDFDIDALMRHDAAHVTEQAYPDSWQQSNLRLPLHYHFEPGSELDGVCVDIPLALLNQVTPDGFDWQVPAFREELVIAWIKSLPKPLRRNFVPAPNYAQACLEAITPYQGRLLEAISKQLLRMTGVRIPEEAWDGSALAEYLKIKFRVVDGDGKPLAWGTDLSALQAQLQGKVQQTLTEVAEDDIERQGLVDWSMPALPEEWVQHHGGFEVKAYPALVDEGSSVALKLVDNPHTAQQQSRAGIRRLVLLNVPSPIKYLQEKLPNKAKLGLYFNPFGKVGELIDDCIACAVDEMIAGRETLPRDAGQFDILKEQVRAELNERVLAIAELVERILRAAHGITKRMKGRVALDQVMAHNDIKQQLAGLIYKGFVSDIGAEQLKQLPRYLQAVERRLEKLPVDPNRDRLQLLQLTELQQSYQQLKDKVRAGQSQPKELEQLRWMLEELRVSLFAQQLGTAYPVSAKRVANLVNEIKQQLV